MNIEPSGVEVLHVEFAAELGMPDVEARRAAEGLLAAAEVFARHVPHDQSQGSSANRFLWAAERAAGLAGQGR